MSVIDDGARKRQARLNLKAALDAGMPFREAFRLHGNPDESYEGFDLDEYGNKVDAHVYGGDDGDPPSGITLTPVDRDPFAQ